MTIYKTLKEVQKDYPSLDINQFTYFQKNYLLNNEIKTIDEDYNINCINCRNCMGCRNCIDCTSCTDCEYCRGYINNKLIK